MLNGLGRKLLDFSSDWLLVRPFGKRALHPRLVELRSAIMVSLLILALTTAVWGAIYLLNSARLR